MCKCQRCGSESYIRSGKVRNKQRYECKKCNYVYVEKDNRVITSELLDAIVVLLYSTGKASYRFIAKLLDVSVTTVYYWIKRIAKSYPDNNIPKEASEIEIDEMWHFVHKKKENAGYLRHWIERQGSALHGLQAREILIQFVSCIKSLNI